MPVMDHGNRVGKLEAMLVWKSRSRQGVWNSVHENPSRGRRSKGHARARSVRGIKLEVPRILEPEVVHHSRRKDAIPVGDQKSFMSAIRPILTYRTGEVGRVSLIVIRGFPIHIIER